MRRNIRMEVRLLLPKSKAESLIQRFEPDECKEDDGESLNLRILKREDGPERPKNDYSSILLECSSRESVYQVFLKSIIERREDGEHLPLKELIARYGIRELEVRGIDKEGGILETFLYETDRVCQYRAEFATESWPKTKLQGCPCYRDLLNRMLDVNENKEVSFNA